MMKLIKYDFIKSRAWYVITAAALLLIEAVFLLGYWTENDDLFSIGGVLFVIAGIFSLLALLIYSVQLYSEELTKKSGYMTFLTPRTAYQIIGSKLIVSFIVLVIGFLVYCALGLLDLQIVVNIQGNLLSRIISMISPNDIPKFLLLIFNTLVQWFVTIITIYFSVTLAATLLGNVKFRWLISAAIFLAINTVVSIISSSLLMDKALRFSFNIARTDSPSFSFFLDNSIELMLISLAINLVLAVGFYFATAALAEKKLSL